MNRLHGIASRETKGRVARRVMPVAIVVLLGSFGSHAPAHDAASRHEGGERFASASHAAEAAHFEHAGPTYLPECLVCMLSKTTHVLSLSQPRLPDPVETGDRALPARADLLPPARLTEGARAPPLS